ncbi:hypothetical protein Dcae01_01826 [Deinococcus caeni]|uniref:Uncharacterized protein n=1 Tax=Deinococcus caeni TaxID=569127 RepID=A0ABP9UCR7_9DEIO
MRLGELPRRVGETEKERNAPPDVAPAGAVTFRIASETNGSPYYSSGWRLRRLRSAPSTTTAAATTTPVTTVAASGRATYTP